MSAGFNPSGRKEDLSVKLRAQNMRNAKDTTKKMEVENRKMEERLRELKMAMNREKEERERQGGGFWQRGQSGTLNTYATEVLHEKANRNNSSGKKRGVKVLKDEPLDLPRRNSGPGTIKYIAQRNPGADLVRDSKNKGNKCGQCEDRPASLTCVQCSENYCAGCFAAFHLKGALKRHRSVPLHATGPRQCMSPRPTPPSSSRSSTSGGASSGDIFYQQADRYGPQGGGASGSSRGGSPADASSLLEGAYNEADSAASFQKALNAWRKGDGEADPEPKPRNKPRKSVKIVSPDKSVRTTEHSTSTGTGQLTPDVKSAPHSLSYAQRLMLRQHRRTELGQLPNPRLGSGDGLTPSSELTSVTPCLSRVGRDGDFFCDNEGGFDGDEERVDFHSLYEAMTTSSEQSGSRTANPKLTVIVDVTNSLREQRSASSESSIYTVEEVSGLEVWETERQARIAEAQEGANLSKVKRLSKSRETTRVIDKRTRIPKSREVTSVLDGSSIAEGDDVPLEMNHSHRSSAKELTQVLSSTRSSLQEMPTVEEGETSTMKKNPHAAMAVQRPKSSKSRPASVSAKSARSRPSSRAQSRAQSRASSRMVVEGLLTKAPSNSLSEIARRGADNSTHYQSPLQGFFLAGVKVEDQVDEPRSRPVTPATPGHSERVKISNKLYAMAPRSWRPDSSLGDNADNADPSIAVPAPISSSKVRYTYSGQMEGQPLEWNPHDSLGTPVPGEGTPAPGEETPAATPTPTPPERAPTPAATPTPTPPERAPTPAATPTPTPHERAPTPAATPTPTPPERAPTPGSSRQRKRWGTSDPSSRPFSAHLANMPVDGNNSSGEIQQQQGRPNSCTGATEPAIKQRRRVPIIDKDLDNDQREITRRQKSNAEGWTADEGQADPVIRQLSAHRTRSWVASQNSLPLDSGEWETEVEEFIQDSGEHGDDLEDGSDVTPRPSSVRQVPMSARSSTMSRNSHSKMSGRLSRAIVMDGEDLSKYDDTDQRLELNRMATEDRETLDKLEWELASETGRLTADGKLSRLSAMEVEEDVRSSGSRSSSSMRRSYDQGYDITTKLKEDELSDGETAEQRIRSSMDLVDEEAVRALR